MLNDIKIGVKIDLKGKRTKCFLLILANRLAFFLFALTLGSAVYLFAVDNSLFRRVGVFENNLTLSASVVAAVLTCFTLLLFSVYMNLRCFIGLSLKEGKPVIELRRVLTALGAYIWKATAAAVYFVIFMLPAAAMAFLVFLSLREGVSRPILIILLTEFAVLALCGLGFYAVFIERYAAVTCCLCEESPSSVREAIRGSIEQMAGKCGTMVSLRIGKLLRLPLCIFVIPIPFVATYWGVASRRLVAYKENPYTPEEMRTEKSVIFYIGKKLQQ